MNNMKIGTRLAMGFGLVLLLVGIATVGTILATGGLGVIAFVPLVGLAVIPLQVAGWLLRGFVFQFIALTALSAYLTYYRHTQRQVGQSASRVVDAAGQFRRSPNTRMRWLTNSLFRRQERRGCC